MGRGGRVLAGLLLFAAGVLVGANAVYFWMTRERPDPTAALVFERERTQHGRSYAGVGTDRSATATRNPAERRPGDAAPVAIPPGSPPAGAEDTGPPRPVPPDAVPVRPTRNPSGLVVPVQGVAPGELHDTFSDARGEDRSHEALDIMAPRGTPVLAVADGHVEKLFDSKPGGLTIYQFDPAGRHAYYYAHLDRYATGLEEGDAVEQGQVIGYVGSTGNASDEAPHLHFGIFELGPEKRWWEGTAINPYPLLAAEGSR